MLAMSVTFEVSKKGTLVNEKHELNIDAVPVTPDVFVSLLNVTICKALHPTNIADMVFNDALVLPISHFFIFIVLKQEPKLVTLPTLIRLTYSASLGYTVVAVLVVPIVNDVKLGQEI